MFFSCLQAKVSRFLDHCTNVTKTVFDSFVVFVVVVTIFVDSFVELRRPLSRFLACKLPGSFLIKSKWEGSG